MCLTHNQSFHQWLCTLRVLSSCCPQTGIVPCSVLMLLLIVTFLEIFSVLGNKEVIPTSYLQVSEGCWWWLVTGKHASSSLGFCFYLSLFLLKAHKVKVKVSPSYLTLCYPMDCSLPGSSVHGILQARILEWVAVFFSRGSSQPRD